MGDAGLDALAPSSITVSAPEARAASAAYRDGDGPWTPADLTSGTFVFPVTSDRYSVAIGCTHTTPPRVDIYELTTADATHLEHTVTCSDMRANVSGSLFQAGTVGVRVAFGDDGRQSQRVTMSPSYALQPPAGTHDLVAVRLAGDPLDADRVIVARSVAAPADATTNADVDFAAMNAIDLEQHTLAVTAISNSPPEVTSELVTAGGTRATLSDRPAPDLRTVPASQLAPGDLDLVTIYRGQLAGEAGPYEQLRRTITNLSDGTITFPAATGVPATLTVTTPGLDEQFTATWPSHPAGAIYVLTVNPPAQGTVFTIEASDAFVGPTFAMQTPDFGGLSGWPFSLRFAPSWPVGWTIDARQGATIDQLLREVPTVETDVTSIGWAGTLTK